MFDGKSGIFLGSGLECFSAFFGNPAINQESAELPSRKWKHIINLGCALVPSKRWAKSVGDHYLQHRFLLADAREWLQFNNWDRAHIVGRPPGYQAHLLRRHGC